MYSEKRNMKVLKIAILAMGLGALVAPVLAGSISLEWDPVANAEGYRIYYAFEPGGYSDTDYFNVGNVTSTTLDNLQDCIEYYLAVKAYNSAGESETFSNEISGWARPEVHTSDLTVTMQGEQVTLELDGTNFMPGADLEIDNPGLYVDSVSVQGCNLLLASLTLDPMSGGVRPAQIGQYAVKVVNPDDVFGDSSNVIDVRVNPERFDVNRGVESTRGRIDGQDTIWMGRLFGTDEGDALYNPDLDMDGDGWVDGEDLSYLASNFGECWSGTGWSAAACPESLR